MPKRKTSSWILLLIAVLLIVPSCGRVKPSTSKGGGALYETFYVGEEGTQYFIKSLSFESDDKSLLVDFTFRYLDRVEGDAIMNFTLVAEGKVKSIDSLRLENHLSNILSSDIKLLFNEKTKKDNISRFSSHIALADLNDLVDGGNWVIWIYEEDATTVFKPTPKTLQSLQKLERSIFDLFKD